MPEPFNKFRAAVEILQRGRDELMEELAEEVVASGDDLAEGGFLFNEFLESQGTRLHFLGLIVSQLELSAEMLEESRRSSQAPRDEAPEPLPEAKPPAKRRKSRSKKLQQASTEGQADEA